jgi:hypothetical protein
VDGRRLLTSFVPMGDAGNAFDIGADINPHCSIPSLRCIAGGEAPLWPGTVVAKSQAAMVRMRRHTKRQG